MVKVFVYGILVGRYNGVPAILEGYEKFFRGHATIRRNEEYFVRGELIDVSEETLAEFDRIEGVAVGYYHRFKTTVFTLDEEPHKDVWVYQQCEDKEDDA